MQCWLKESGRRAGLKPKEIIWQRALGRKKATDIDNSKSTVTNFPPVSHPASVLKTKRVGVPSKENHSGACLAASLKGI